MSTITIGRSARPAMTGASSSRRRIAWGASVDEITMSAPRSSWASRSKPTPRPPTRPASSLAVPTVRLATTTSRTPWATSARAVVSAIRPAPISSTWRPGRSSSTSSASSTATADTDADPAPMRV